MTIRTGEKYTVETIQDFTDRLDADLIEIAEACIGEGDATEDLLLTSARENGDMIDEEAIDTPDDGEPGIEDIHEDMLYEVLYNEYWPQAIIHTLEARDAEYTHTRESHANVHHIIKLHPVAPPA